MCKGPWQKWGVRRVKEVRGVGQAVGTRLIGGGTSDTTRVKATERENRTGRGCGNERGPGVGMSS